MIRQDFDRALRAAAQDVAFLIMPERVRVAKSLPLHANCLVPHKRPAGGTIRVGSDELKQKFRTSGEEATSG